MVMRDYEGNSIFIVSTKNCEIKSIVNAYEILYKILATKGLKARFQKLDNEASIILIQSPQDETLALSWCQQTFTCTMQVNE